MRVDEGRIVKEERKTGDRAQQKGLQKGRAKLL